MTFLEIAGHDNDFTQPCEEALKQLWEWMNENNGWVKDSNGNHQLVKYFKLMHKEGNLKPAIKKLWILRTIAYRVENLTRCLYMAPKTWSSHDEKPGPEEYIFLEDYLDFKIYFRQRDKFIAKDKNGEHAWLDLETGEVGSF